MEHKKEHISFFTDEKSADYDIIDRCLVIRMKQDVDHHLALSIREKSDFLIEKRNIRNIIFDFDLVNFMDSSGVGLIMGRYKRVIFTGGNVAITNVSSSIDRIFKLSGLYKIIKKYDVMEEAVEELRVL